MPDFAQGLCLCGIIIGIAVVYYGLVPFGYCQWIGLQWLVGESVEEMIVVHSVVLPAIFQN